MIFWFLIVCFLLLSGWLLLSLFGFSHVSSSSVSFGHLLTIFILLTYIAKSLLLMRLLLGCVLSANKLCIAGVVVDGGGWTKQQLKNVWPRSVRGDNETRKEVDMQAKRKG